MSFWNWALGGMIILFFLTGLNCGIKERPEVTGFLLICFVALFFGLGLGAAINYLASL
jgi:hypothetical protein